MTAPTLRWQSAAKHQKMQLNGSAGSTVYICLTCKCTCVNDNACDPRQRYHVSFGTRLQVRQGDGGTALYTVRCLILGGPWLPHASNRDGLIMEHLPFSAVDLRVSDA